MKSIATFKKVIFSGLLVGALSGTFNETANALSCEDLFLLKTGYDALSTPPQPAYLKHLETFVGRLYENFVFPLPDYGKGGDYTQFSYKGTRLVKREEAIHEGVGLGMGRYLLPSDVVIARQFQFVSPRRNYPKSAKKNGVTYKLSKEDSLLYAFADRRYTLATISDAVTIAATNQNLYVLEVNRGPGRGTSILKEYSLPSTLPQRHPVTLKTFDLSEALSSDLTPVVFPYGRFLLLGGKDMMILDPALNALLKVEIPGDQWNSSVVGFSDLGAGRIEVLQRYEDRNSIPRVVVTSTVLDFSKLQIPLRR